MGWRARARSVANGVWTPTWRDRTPIGSLAGAEREHSQTKTRRRGQAKPQPVISDKAVIPPDIASLGTLTETISGEVGQYGFNEEIEHEWNSVSQKMARMRCVAGWRMWDDSRHHR